MCIKNLEGITQEDPNFLIKYCSTNSSGIQKKYYVKKVQPCHELWRYPQNSLVIFPLFSKDLQYIKKIVIS